MALNKNIVTANNNSEIGGFSLGSSGNSLRQQGKLSVEAPALQEYKVENGRKTFIGEAIVGDEAIKIVASYLSANEDRAFERFVTAVDNVAKKTDFVKKDRGMNPNESVEQRAARYIRGVVLGALNTVPSTFTVGDRHFMYSKMSYTAEYDPYDLDQVMQGKASIGVGAAIEKIDSSEGRSGNNAIAVSKDLLQKAVSYFMTKLNIVLEGNTLKVNNIPIVSFTTPDVNAKILSAVSTYDLNEIKVF